MGHTAQQVQPVRPSVWIFGEAGGIQVWAAVGDENVRASVLIGQGPPIVILNQRIIGTPCEYPALSWALAQVAERGQGFYVLCAD